MKPEYKRNSRLRHRLLTAAVAAAGILTTVLLVTPGEAQIKVKMATLVPEGTSWAKIIKEAAEKWKRVACGDPQRWTVREFTSAPVGTSRLFLCWPARSRHCRSYIHCPLHIVLRQCWWRA